MDLDLRHGWPRRAVLSQIALLPLLGCASQVEDGGHAQSHWRILPTEPYPRKQDDVFFISRSTGWYGNGSGKLYRTGDGGETWDLVWEQAGTFIRALGFVDERNGFLGNVGVGYAPSVEDPTPLYRTRDGGATWTPVEAQGIEAVGGVCAIDILPQRSIYAGEVRSIPLIHAAGRVGGPPTIMRSLDGGESWSISDLRDTAGMILDVKFLTPAIGLLCIATSTDLEQSNGAILRTTDGGQTWQIVYRSSRSLELCWKMSFPSAATGYATVQNNSNDVADQVILKTTDGGASWRELLLCRAAGMREFGVGFLNERRGWVGTSTSGFETNNGGLTWRPMDFGASVNKIRIVREANAFAAFAIGRNLARLDGRVG